MKVKVKVIAPPYTNAETASLEAILHNHAHDRLTFHIGTKRLYNIMEELARRSKMSSNSGKSSREAWADFVKYYYLELDTGSTRPFSLNPVNLDILYLKAFLKQLSE